MKLGDVLKIQPNDWMRLGELIAKWVRKDMEKGVMQNDTQGHRYSRQYARYKANEMRRFTDGKRLKQYYASPIESTQTSYVDMTLTGRLKRSLQPLRALSNGVRMAFGSENTGKILGGQKLGRDVVGLNENNQKKTLEWIASQIDEKIEDWEKEEIKINIKF